VLTLVGIVWGSTAVVLLLSLGAGFYAFLDIGFKKTGDRYTAVVGEYTTAESGGARPGRRIRLTREDLPRLRASAPSASRIAAEIQHASAALRTSRRTRTGAVSAATPDVQHIQVLRVARGRFYDEEDVRLTRAVAVLGASLPEVFFGSEDPLGRTLQIEGKPFVVVGVLARKGPQLVINNALHDDMVFVPLTSGQRAFGARSEIGEVLLDPRTLGEIERMHAEVRETLRPVHHIAPRDPGALRIESITEVTEPFRRIALGLTALLGLVGTVTLAMAGVGLANLMIAIVQSRLAELAMRRACGARRGDLTLQLLVETGLVVLCGGALGVVTAMAIVSALRNLPLPEMVPRPEISLGVLGTALGVLCATGLLAGVVPARTASRVDPAAALRVI
jgi:putative ABC transport system permease protein